MAKNKRELQTELEAANKRIAELSQSNQNANSNINNDEPPSWLKTFLEAQLSMQRQTQEQNVENQRQMQLESQRQMQQITLVNTQIFATDIILILGDIRCVDFENDIHFC